MLFFSSSYTFNYDWAEVSTANWRKYCPWNTSSSHVIAVDTLSRRIDPLTGILITERLITCKQSAPALMKVILGGQDTTHSYEKSYVDPSKKQVTMYSNNITWNNLISVRETVNYQPDTSASKPGHERTKFSQEARITALCGGWQRARTKIEEITLERFLENARKGREGFEAVLEMSRRGFVEEREKEAQQRESAET